MEVNSELAERQSDKLLESLGKKDLLFIYPEEGVVVKNMSEKERERSCGNIYNQSSFFGGQ